MTVLVAGLLAGGGVLVGFWLGRRRREQGPPWRGRGTLLPHVVPDPALAWLRLAHGATAAWLLDRRDEAGRAGRTVHLSVGSAGLPPGEEEAIEARLGQLDAEAPPGVERRETGLLVYATGPSIAALLVPPGSPMEATASVQQDLEALLVALGHRTIIRTLAKPDGGATESVESIGLRLAYQIERIVEAEAVVVLVRGAGAEVVGISGRGDRRLLGRILPDACPLARVARGTGEELLTADDPAGGVIADRRRPRQARIFPLRSREAVLGSVALAFTGDVPSGAVAEVRFALENAAERFATAAEVGKHQREALIDPLTGLPNRRGFESALHRIHESHGAFIAADIDRFKLLNDTLGHPAGDAALVHVGRVIREQIRGRDTAGRTGGEEFAIWLPQTSLEEALTVAERIRSALGTSNWSWQGRRWPLGASLGVAACPGTTRSKDNLPVQADQALYQAKEAGRDCVVAAPRQP